MAALDMETRRALSPSSGVVLQWPAVTPATSGLKITSPACAYCSALPICSFTLQTMTDIEDFVNVVAHKLVAHKLSDLTLGLVFKQ